MNSGNLASQEAAHGRSIEAEVRLCWQIILKAVLDAIYGGSLARDNYARIRSNAFEWFAEAGPDFQLICDCADLNPQSVRLDALRYIIAQRKTLSPQSRRPRLTSPASVKRMAA